MNCRHRRIDLLEKRQKSKTDSRKTLSRRGLVTAASTGIGAMALAGAAAGRAAAAVPEHWDFEADVVVAG